MTERTQIVIVNDFQEFVSGTRFVDEYPAATVFESKADAKRTVKAMKATKNYCCSFYLVTSYGMQNEVRVKV